MFGKISLLHGAAFDVVLTYLPLVLLVVHACWTFGIKRGSAFITLAGLVGFLAEAISLNHGTLFGSTYVYSSSEGLALLKVPVSIIAYWAIFIYLGYWLVTSSAYWLGKMKPSRAKNPLCLLLLLVMADGLAVTAIDLFMDPISVKAGFWSWINGGPYFGVPIGNFIGWFIITIIVTGLFRTFEYYRPSESLERSHAVHLMPVFGYLLVGLSYLAGAISYHLIGLAAIGTIIVIAPAVVSIVLYLRYRYRQAFRT